MASVVYTEKCVGCRSCEIACSYHFKKNFSRKNTAIKVLRWESEGEFGIVLYRQAEDGHMACEGCNFCLEYCPEVARDELKAILEGKVAQGRRNG